MKHVILLGISVFVMLVSSSCKRRTPFENAFGMPLPSPLSVQTEKEIISSGYKSIIYEAIIVGDVEALDQFPAMLKLHPPSGEQLVAFVNLRGMPPFPNPFYAVESSNYYCKVTKNIKGVEIERVACLIDKDRLYRFKEGWAAKYISH